METGVNDHIKEYLDYYNSITLSPEFAVLLRGKWGSGKSEAVVGVVTDNCAAGKIWGEAKPVVVGDNTNNGGGVTLRVSHKRDACGSNEERTPEINTSLVNPTQNPPLNPRQQ